jgi:hypothetical protein
VANSANTLKKRRGFSTGGRNFEAVPSFRLSYGSSGRKERFPHCFPAGNSRKNQRRRHSAFESLSIANGVPAGCSAYFADWFFGRHVRSFCGANLASVVNTNSSSDFCHKLALTPCGSAIAKCLAIFRALRQSSVAPTRAFGEANGYERAPLGNKWDHCRI